jgi:hypothetical protein
VRGGKDGVLVVYRLILDRRSGPGRKREFNVTPDAERGQRQGTMAEEDEMGCLVAEEEEKAGGV